MTKTATPVLHPLQATTVQGCIRRSRQFTPPPTTQAFSFPKSMRPICQKQLTTSPLTKPANNSTHSAPPSAEIQLAQANEHPLMQAIEVCKQSVHTTAKALSTAGHAVAKAANATGHAIHTAATTVKTAWHTFTSLKAVQFIIKFFQSTYPCGRNVIASPIPSTPSSSPHFPHSKLFLFNGACIPNRNMKKA